MNSMMPAQKYNSDLLSELECIEIVRNSTDLKSFQIDSIELEYKSESPMGFLGEYLQLMISTRQDLEIRHHKYFVKCLTALEGEEQAIKNIFRKEANMYATILLDLDLFSRAPLLASLCLHYKSKLEISLLGRIKWMPNCYLVRPDLIVLEDLLLTQHVHVPASIDLSSNHVKCLLQSLAAMHAASITYETKLNVNLGELHEDILVEYSIARNISWFEAGIKCLKDILKIHPKFQSTQHQMFIVNDFEQALDPVYELVGESSKFRNVVCHRDAWRNNALFIFENQDVTKPLSATLIDFQLCRYSPPAIDVLLCIYFNLKRSVRQSIEKECLAWYYECLAIELNHFGIDISDHISWEAFLKSCDHVKLVATLYNGIAATVIRVPKDILHDIRNNNPELYRKYRTSDRIDVILEVMEKDENFKNFMFEACEEIIEELLTRQSLKAVN